MRFVHYICSGIESYGILVDTKIIGLNTLAAALETPIPLTIEEFIGLGDDGIRTAEQLMLNSTKTEKRKATLKIGDAPLLAPIFSPPKIICLGLNYRDHAQEAGANIPEEPIVFMKPRTALVGPDEPIIRPTFVKELDYEAELAIVIGRKGRNIPVSEAEKYVFGYTAFNDISAREIQFKDRQWTRGKSFDTFAPTGPCITTSDQIGNPNNLNIRTRVNGALRQDSSTKNMVFNVNEVVYHISRVMTLEPCDIIATGTPAGVAVFMKPTPKFLSPGDLVEVEIENIGTLRNQVTEGS